MSVPIQKPGRSKQDYGTPPELIIAVERRFGSMTVDLAATAENTKCPSFISPEQDSLTVNWSRELAQTQCWLNPPFSRIEPWAEKCAHYSYSSTTGRIFLLVPASVGANWYRDYVHQKAYVIALNGRITFVGETMPYPKDCIIAIYGAGIKGFEVWPWPNWVGAIGD